MSDGQMAVVESVQEMPPVVSQLRRNGRVHDAPVIELPCCGFMLDVEQTDCVPELPSTVHWPPRWTCPQCDRAFTFEPLTGDLRDEMGMPA